MSRTHAQQQEWEQRMAQAWLDARLPIAECPSCGGMADGQGMCLVRCDRQPVRPAVTLAMVLGAVMTI